MEALAILSPSFIDGTPILEIIIRNPVMNKSFPSEGEVVAVLDTGFEGFLLVPEEIFRESSLNQLTTEQRQLILSNGLSIESVGTFGEVIIPSAGLRFEGFIETIKGVDEIVVGSELMENLRLILDYCVRRVEIISCKSPSGKDDHDKPATKNRFLRLKYQAS